MANNEHVCPHGVENRQWGFSDEISPRNLVVRQLVILNSEMCPSCLLERVANLRGAIELILMGSKPRQEVERVLFDRGLRLFYDDQSQHLGPSIPEAVHKMRSIG